VKRSRRHQSNIWSVDWAPDGSGIASGWRGQLHLWDPCIGSLLATYHGHIGCVYGLA
jgi:WD40 repeat protein